MFLVECLEVRFDGRDKGRRSDQFSSYHIILVVNLLKVAALLLKRQAANLVLIFSVLRRVVLALNRRFSGDNHLHWYWQS
jgi:hypothetical protein